MPYVPRNLLRYLKASEVTFLPTISINWDTLPGTVQLALDELASRVTYIEAYGTSGGSGVGASGFSGYSGYSGFSGYSGYSGPSGYSGSVGAGGTLGYWGSFYDTNTQTNSGYSGATIYSNVLHIGSTDPDSFGIYIVDNNKITVSQAGVYNIQISLQLVKTDGGDDSFDVWFRLNGNDIPNSNTDFMVQNNNGRNVAALNFMLELAANDYIQIAWSSSDQFMQLLYESGKTNPIRPDIPSAIVTVQQVMYTQSGFSGRSGYSGFTGYSGFSGYTGFTGYSGFSGSVTDATFVPLGTPTDGSWTDGINDWTSTTHVADALDDCNELLFYLAPSNSSSLSGDLTSAGTSLYTGYVSDGNTNYKSGSGAGSLYSTIINDPTFTLTNPNTSTSFNYADIGNTKWYKAVGTASYGAAEDSVDHAANFSETYRASSQISTPWTDGQLSVTSVAWYNSFPKWQKGNSTITITAAQLSQGYNKIKMTREGSFVTQSTNDFELFYDNDAGSNPSVSATPTVIEGTTVNARYLSGVKFYDRGTQFKVGCVALDCFDNVFVLNPLVITSSNSNSMGNANIPWNDATVTGVSSPPYIGDTMTVTDKIITVPSSNVRSANARVTITPNDPYGSYTGVQSASENRLVDGYLNDATGTSTDTAEYFDDEHYRMLSNFNTSSTSYSSGGAGGWDSSVSLVSGTTGYDGLQCFNGGLKYPTTNYSTGYLPSSGQPNYSSASGNRVYIRYFYVGGGVQNVTFTISNQSGTTNFVSVATGVSANNLTLELLAPATTKDGSNNVEFKDCYVAYTTDTAIGCYVSGTRSSSTSNWACTLGTKSTSTSGSVIVIRITSSSSWVGALEGISVAVS